MAVKLHRCPNIWVKLNGHPCWKVQKALDDQGVDYEIVTGPWLARSKRRALRDGTGQSQFPAIEFEDGSWYREQSKDMARTIREGRLMEKSRTASSAAPEST
jgi:glutaredoxin